MRKAKDLNFKHYTARGSNVPDVWWIEQLPLDLDFKDIVAELQYDPTADRIRIGYLKHLWNGHPKDCLIIARDTINLLEGDDFAVSENSVHHPFESGTKGTV